ncbi:MAG: NADPH:quinone oxidoreductase family protein [Kiloniellales bacterium]|nr:NADPH:quinone oxidoreductase family protein [Kiloniellales bacterium]
MRAVVCRELSGPQSLSVEELPDPQPGPGEVAIAVAAAGVNFADTLMVTGKYQEKPELPFTPGLELAGTVTALGPGVTGVATGDRVIGLVDRGAFAEVALVRADEVYPIPDSMDFDIAAGFPITYGTAHGALVWRADLKQGETLLVHGAAGGVGLAAVEVGKALGAEVIATAGGAEKLEIARAHGADQLIDYRSEDIRERVKALTGGRGADVVFDPVGGEVFMASLRAVAWGGRLLVIGFAAGKVPEIPANLLLVKNLAVLGLYWGAYRQKGPDLLRAQFETLTRWHAEGRLEPLVSHRLDLAEAAEALDLLLTRKATGKVVLTTGRG